MTTYNTGNPLGSTDPRDLFDNAENLDGAVNSTTSNTWVDRLGVTRKTYHGMEEEFDGDQARRENEFQSDQEGRSDRFNDFIASSGYQFVGDYAPDIEITEYNQLVRDENGEFWRVSGQVDLPYVTTGAGIPEDDALVPAGDAALRQDLANPDKGAAMVARGVVAVDNIADLLDLPEGVRRSDLRYAVASYHAGWAVAVPYIGPVGGGEFAYDATRTSENDGGTILDGFVRVFGGEVDYRWFGARGDGVSNDTSAILAALTAYPADCVFKGGTFVFGDLSVSNTAHVRLASIGSAKIVASPESSYLIAATNCGKFSASGLSITESTNAAITGVNNLIQLTGCPRVHLFSCSAPSLKRPFIDAKLAYGFSGATRVTIRSCDIDGVGHAGLTSYTACINFEGPYKNGRITNTTIETVNGNGIRVYPATSDGELDDTPGDWVLSKNRIIGCLRPRDGEGQCVYYRGHDLTLSKNYLALAGRNVVDVQGPDNQTAPARNIKVLGNTFLNRSDFMGSNAATLLHLRCCHSKVIGNTFYGAGYGPEHRGIRAKWGGSLIASGNEFPRETIDGFTHLINDDLIHISTAATINTAPFMHCTVTGNSGTVSTLNKAFLLVTSNSDQLIDNVVLSGNTMRASAGRHLLKVTENHTGVTPRTRFVSLTGNSVGYANMIDPSSVANVFRGAPIDHGSKSTEEIPTNTFGGSIVYNSSARRPMWWNSHSTRLRWEFADGTVPA